MDMRTSITVGTLNAILLACASAGSGCASSRTNDSPPPTATGSIFTATAAPAQPSDSLELGNFSISLAVKDIAASRAFYEALGFRVIGGDQAQNWLILQNNTATIGLFQGMFERNMLTFNPGWDRSSNTLAAFTDIRDLQAALRAKGLTPTLAADESSTGPASLMLTDPDGNPILLDQHIPKPSN